HQRVVSQTGEREAHDRLHHPGVVRQPRQIWSSFRVAGPRSQLRGGKLVGQILYDGDRFGDEPAIIDEGRNLLVGMRVGRVGRAGTVHPRDVGDLQRIVCAKLFEEPDDPRGARLWRVVEGQHGDLRGSIRSGMNDRRTWAMRSMLGVRYPMTPWL